MKKKDDEGEAAQIEEKDGQSDGSSERAEAGIDQEREIFEQGETPSCTIKDIAQPGTSLVEDGAAENQAHIEQDHGDSGTQGGVKEDAVVKQGAKNLASTEDGKV